MAISGYADFLSVQHGATLNIYVSTDAPKFRVEFYRGHAVARSSRRAKRAGGQPARRLGLACICVDHSAELADRRLYRHARGGNLPVIHTIGPCQDAPWRGAASAAWSTPSRIGADLPVAGIAVRKSPACA